MVVIALAHSLCDAAMLPSEPCLSAFVQFIIHLVLCPHKAIDGGDLYLTPDTLDIPCRLPFLISSLLRFGLAMRGVDVGSGILSCNSISLHWLVGAIGMLIRLLPPAIVCFVSRGALGYVTFVRGPSLQSLILP